MAATAAKKTAKKTAKPAAKKAATKAAKPSASKRVDTASNAVDEQLARYRSMRDFKSPRSPAVPARLQSLPSPSPPPTFPSSYKSTPPRICITTSASAGMAC